MQIVIQLNPQQGVWHSQVGRNLLDGNISRSTTLRKTVAWMEKNSNFIVAESREHDRRDLLKPFSRILGLALHATPNG
jgi:hypothetical protein